FVEAFTFANYRVAGAAAHHIIAYSDDYADNSYYIAPFREKAIAVHPPVKLPAPDERRAAEMRAEWLAGAPGASRLIGSSGRCVGERRTDVLFRALPAGQEKYPGTKIVFAGEYLIKYENFFEPNADLIARHRDDLIFLGLLKDPKELASFYRAIDVLALPSDTE